MRKLATFGAIWLAAAAVAVAVAWQGVGMVTRQVTDDRPAPLAAGEVRDLAAAATTTLPADAAPATTVAGPPDAGGPAPTLPTPAPPSTAASGPVPGSGPAATIPATTPTPAPATATTTAPAADETRTYNLTGGTVALRFAPEGVTVAFANPKAGFEVDVEPEHGNGVQVRFESDTHRSRVSGWWEDGPQDDTREDER